MSSSVFITGAATGIGRACAHYFYAQGWFVGAGDVDEVGLASLRAELGADRCFTVALDVTDSAAWAQALDQFWTAAGQRLDVLVNNAGVLASGDFVEIPLARHRSIIDINVQGVINGCHVAFPYLRRTPDACVVNLASASAIYGQPGLASYSASKFAVRGLTEALDAEWHVHGIRVRSVWPLFVQTGMVRGMDIGSVKSLGVRLTADDVASAVFAASQDHASVSSVHRTVGLQAGVLRVATRFSPDVLTRWLNRRLAGGR